MHYFVFLDEKDGLADRLLFWAREAEEPLCSYATGLLAGAMEIQDVAHSHRESNILMVVAFFLPPCCCCQCYLFGHLCMPMSICVDTDMVSTGLSSI